MTNLSAPVSTTQTFSDYLKDQIRRKRILSIVPTSYPVRKLNSIKPNIFQSRDNTSTSSANGKHVLTRLQQLDNALKTIRSAVKNDTEVINQLKSEVQTSSAENAKSQAENMKRIGSTKIRMKNNYFSKNGRNINERPKINIDKGKKNDRNENSQDKNIGTAIVTANNN